MTLSRDPAASHPMLKLPLGRLATVRSPAHRQACQIDLRLVNVPLLQPTLALTRTAGIPTVALAVYSEIGTQRVRSSAIAIPRLMSRMRKVHLEDQHGTDLCMVNGNRLIGIQAFQHGTTAAHNHPLPKVNGFLLRTPDRLLALVLSRVIRSHWGPSPAAVDSRRCPCKLDKASHPLHRANRPTRASNNHSPRASEPPLLRPLRQGPPRWAWLPLAKREGAKVATSSCSIAIFSPWAQMANAVAARLLSPRPCKARKLHSLAPRANRVSRMSWAGSFLASAAVSGV